MCSVSLSLRGQEYLPGMETIFVEDGILEDANEIIAELFDHSDITDLECDSDGWDLTLFYLKKQAQQSTVILPVSKLFERPLQL